MQFWLACEHMKTWPFLDIFTDICMIILCLLWGTQHFTIYLICIPCKYYINLKTNLNVYIIVLMGNQNLLFQLQKTNKIFSILLLWWKSKRQLKISDGSYLCEYLAKLSHFSGTVKRVNYFYFGVQQPCNVKLFKKSNENIYESFYFKLIFCF